MFTNDAHNTSSIQPYASGTQEINAVEENEGRAKMQENKAYQATADLHLICNPPYGTSKCS